ncbi:MAG TPA: hypothetical protein PLF81_22670, partial [Candidatus Anammoximicrobium sp.]|nr:hypothetical protein [Candidatus Anammoximicrobium sp.]
MNQALGWLLGLKNVKSIDEIAPSLAASWAAEGSFWVFFALAALLVASLVFYLKYQRRGSRGARLALGLSRGLLLILLLLTLADPVLRVSLTDVKPPLVYLVFDGTDSMAIQDEFPDEQASALARATGWQPPEGVANKKPSRADYLQSLLSKERDNLLVRLAEDKRYRLEAFVFDGNTTSQLRKLELRAGGGDTPDPKYVAGQLTTRGQVTALGAALNDMSQQFGAGNLAAVVMFSDFAQNSGVAPIGGQSESSSSPAARLGVPVYTVGLGAIEALDLAVDLQTDPKMKRAERTNVLAKLRQSGLQDRSVTVTVTARKLSGEFGASESAEILIGQKTVPLKTNLETVEFPFTPEDAGRFEFIAAVEPQDGEIVAENNRATREVNIIDDYLRLMYVAY